MNNLYDVLEVCLQEIEAGADVDTVLFRYPELADELRPILDASVQARILAVPGPAPDVIRRSRARVLQHAAQLREAKVPISRRWWSVPLRRALVGMAVMVALFMSGTGLVRAASSTLPGDRLYPVKRTWENVLLVFTFDADSRQALETQHENERLEELEELFADGRSAQVDFAGRVTRQNGDLWLVFKIPVILSAQTDGPVQSIVVGDAVRVRGVTQNDGSVLAERIELLTAGVPLPQVREDDSPVIGQPEDSDEADEDNSGQGSGDETPDVEKIETPKAQTTPEKLSLTGTVASINGSIVIVNGQPMDISQAEIKGVPATGVVVKAEGYYDVNGVFIVTRIEFVSSGSNGGGSTTSNDNGNDNGNDDNGGSNDDGGSDDNGGSNRNNNDDGNDDTNDDNSNDHGGSD